MMIGISLLAFLFGIMQHIDWEEIKKFIEHINKTTSQTPS